MSAAERVGSWPEVLSLIIEFLEFDRASLYSAHLVNTTWAHYARKVLWRNASLSSLAAIEPSHQQHYANMIKISFSWDMRYPAELDKLSFPSLERCLLDVAQIFDFSDYRLVLPPFFKASPQYLDMWLQGIHDPETISSYWRLGPGLFDDKLDRRHAPRRDRVNDTNSFMIIAPKLRSFLSASHLPMHNVDEALQHLALHAICEELFVGDILYHTKAVDSLLSTHLQRPVFPKLKHFGAHIASGPVGAMFAAFLPPTLSSIYLGVDDLSGQYLQLVSQYDVLQSLTIVAHFLDDMSSIMFLRRLKHLHSLHIELSVPGYHTQIGWTQSHETPFTDGDFEIMTSGLHLLHNFVLELPCKLSLPALTSLATNRPRLQTCQLSTAIPIASWRAQAAPIFPELETLVLTHGEYGDIRGGTERATRWSSSNTQPRPTMKMVDESMVISRRCPKLEQLHLYLRNYGREELERARTREERPGWLDIVLNGTD